MHDYIRNGTTTVFAALAFAAELQRENPTRRAASGPSRRGRHNSIFPPDDQAA